jgi:hypothetical protein
LWRGPRWTQGYGQIKASGQRYRAHRVSYILHVGPIPDGLIIRHSCDTPPCCQPAHLLTGTYGDNNRDRAERDRTIAPRGTSQHMSKLTEPDVHAIRLLSTQGVPQRAIARQYGVSQTAVWAIVAGRTWRHVP